MRRLVCCVLTLFACTAPASIPAQPQPIPLGSRVRVETRRPHRVDGTLMSQTADSVIVAMPGALRTVVATDSIARIRLSGGRSHARGAMKGLKIGALIGGVGMGLVVGGAAVVYGGGPDALAWVGAAAVGGGIGGAFYGVLIGSAFSVEKWTTVYTSPVRVALGPGVGGRPGIVVSLRF